MELTPINPRAAIDWRELPLIGTGSFAWVFELDCERVLKLTCCEATHALYASALKQPRSWPAALPKVHQCLGPLARDEDGVQYTGYIIERLFAPADWAQASRSARALAAGRRVRSGLLEPLMPKAQVEELQALLALAKQYQPSPEQGGWRAQQDFALRMACASQDELRDAFILLALFTAERQSCFDLSAANIMLDCQGRLRLADPVSIGCDEPGPPVNRQYVMVDVPVRQHGFEVDAIPCARPTQSDLESDKVCESLRGLGLRPSVTQDVSTLTRHLRTPSRRKLAFDYPQLRTALETGAYLQALWQATD